MSQDFSGPNNDDGEIEGSGNAEEPPNSNASQFYKDVINVGAPIYPGNEKYTKMTLSGKFLDLKNMPKCSEKMFNSLLVLLADVLPKDNTLPLTCYSMKTMMSKLSLGYKKIEAYQIDFMLYYENDALKLVCDICGEDRYKSQKIKNGKGIPNKILRYFPLIPHLQRLYMSEHTPKYMTWYKNREIKPGELSHPVDGDEWKQFDQHYPSFARESRNIRLGIGADGFNSFDNSGKKVYRVWPLVVVVYNLPPSTGMKKSITFLTLLVPGEKSLGKDLNVYLQPLIDELKLLWGVCVETFDQSKKQTFTMKAAVMWTITDFPGLGMISGWSTNGKLSCPICMLEIFKVFN